MRRLSITGIAGDLPGAGERKKSVRAQEEEEDLNSVDVTSLLSREELVHSVRKALAAAKEAKLEDPIVGQSETLERR